MTTNEEWLQAILLIGGILSTGLIAGLLGHIADLNSELKTLMKQKNR